MNASGRSSVRSPTIPLFPATALTSTAQSAGNEGAAGQPGSRGQPGTTSLRHVKFSAVVDAYEEWLADHTTPEVLRERLARLQPIEG